MYFFWIPGIGDISNRNSLAIGKEKYLQEKSVKG